MVGNADDCWLVRSGVCEDTDVESVADTVRLVWIGLSDAVVPDDVENDVTITAVEGDPGDF